MSLMHDIQDGNLTAFAKSSTSANTPVTSGSIDLSEVGGIEEAHYVVEVPTASKALTIAIVGDNAENGEFSTTVATWTTTAATAFEPVRERIPLNAPRYWKLRVTTGAQVPATAVTAKLTVRV